MGVYAGIDEAGYGPLLGPLVVSMAAFRVPGPVGPEHPQDLWERIGDAAVLHAPPSAGRGGRKAADRDERLIVCDSKKVYQGGKGLRRMEESVLSFMAAGPPESAAVTLRGCLAASGHDEGALEPYPWYRGRDVPLPSFGFKTVQKRQSAALRRALAASGVEALGLRPHAVHPLEFNGGVRRDGNKHLFEWSIVGAFLRELWDRHAAEGVDVACDKLGGRDFYGPPLARLFPEARVTAPVEGGDRSVYRVTRGAWRMTVTFLVEGDDKCFPVALASCCSKYVRELFMGLMNSFFVERLPGLRETAGYYGDGRRFADEVRDEMRRIAADERLLVRCC